MPRKSPDRSLSPSLARRIRRASWRLHEDAVKTSIPRTFRRTALLWQAHRIPGIVGTILRTLDAVGGSALYVLDGGVDPFHPTAVRAAMGASFVIPIVEAGFGEFDDWRRARGMQLIGSSAHAPTDYRGILPLEPWVLLLGNEQKGLSEVQQKACDVVVRLPMRGHATSLNLAVASGILLFEYAAAGTG